MNFKIQLDKFRKIIYNGIRVTCTLQAKKETFGGIYLCLRN